MVTCFYLRNGGIEREGGRGSGSFPCGKAGPIGPPETERCPGSELVLPASDVRFPIGPLKFILRHSGRPS